MVTRALLRQVHKARILPLTSLNEKENEMS